MKEVTLYTDGSCLKNPGPGGWAAVLKHGEVTKNISGGAPYTTNNKMELTAVLQGLYALRYPCEVEVVTDSQYVTNAINKGWIENWAETKFSGRKNGNLWAQLYKLMKIHKITFTWVRGHNGHYYNEICDKLAQSEAKRYAGQSSY